MDVRLVQISTAITILLGIVAGCDRDESIRTYNAPKDQAGEMIGGVRMVVPPSWEKQPDKPLRIVTFKAGNAEVVITRFGAETFAMLLTNINRWRGQVALAPLPEGTKISGEDFAVGKSKGQMFDFPGPERRIRVAVASAGPSLWFFKIEGTLAAVAEQQSTFDEFVHSVQLGGTTETGEIPLH